MLKKLLIVIFILCIILLVLYFGLKLFTDGKKYYAVINNREIQLEIADTSEKRYLGLSYKEALCADCGMLFIFKEKRIPSFVMRDMKFPIDIIWIDDNKIIDINKNLLPEEPPYTKYNPHEPINLVLEVNAGFSDKQNIKAGDEINFYKN